MAFIIPAMPLAVNIWRNQGTGGNYAAPDVVTVCNLSIGKRSMINTQDVGVEILLPAHTDIRSQWNSVAPDILEVPAGTKRFYAVYKVEDIGKGFANEHRLAMVAYLINGNSTLAGGPFPAPVPLP